MRTCPNCGCYIPDNWTTCPACNSITTENKEKSKWVKNTVLIYRVDVLDDDERTKTQEFFGIFDNAYHYAVRQAQKSDVLATQIIYQGRILMTISY